MKKTEINRNIALLAAVEGDTYTSNIDGVEVEFVGELDDDMVKRVMSLLATEVESFNTDTN